MFITLFITSLGWAQQETGIPLQSQQPFQQPKKLQQAPLQFQKQLGQGVVTTGNSMVLCVQSQMIGNAAKFYGNQQLCMGDQGNLSTSAEDMGNKQCKNQCEAVGCLTVKTIPKKLTGKPKGCKKPDRSKSTVYGLASTGQFNCKCEY